MYIVNNLHQLLMQQKVLVEYLEDMSAYAAYPNILLVSFENIDIWDIRFNHNFFISSQMIPGKNISARYFKY